MAPPADHHRHRHRARGHAGGASGGLAGHLFPSLAAHAAAVGRRALCGTTCANCRSGAAGHSRGAHIASIISWACGGCPRPRAGRWACSATRSPRGSNARMGIVRSRCMKTLSSAAPSLPISASSRGCAIRWLGFCASGGIAGCPGDRAWGVRPPLWLLAAAAHDTQGVLGGRLKDLCARLRPQCDDLTGRAAGRVRLLRFERLVEDFALLQKDWGPARPAASPGKRLVCALADGGAGRAGHAGRAGL